MELLQKFVDAVCAIAQELKTMNDLNRSLDPEAGKRPMQRIEPTTLPEPDLVNAERVRVKARLTELGVVFGPKEGMPRLQTRLAEAEAAVAVKKAVAVATPLAAVAAPEDDVFGAAVATPVHTIDEARAAVIAALESFAGGKKEAVTPEAWNASAQKVKEIVVKQGGAVALKDIAPERYGVLIMALNAAVAAGKK